MIRCYVGIMALAMTLFPLAAQAGRGMNRATGQAIWDAAVNGKTTTLGIGQGAMLVIKPTTTGTPSRLTGGGATVVDTMPLPVGGVNVPVSATTNVAKDAIVGGVVGLATGGLLGGAIGVAMPLTQAWLDQSSLRVNPVSAAPERNPSGACGVLATCERWRAESNGWRVEGWGKADACAATVGKSVIDGSQTVVVTSSAIFGAAVCGFGYTRSNGTVVAPGAGAGVTMTYQVLPTPSPTWEPATPQQVRDALYKNDPPPAIIDELSKYGNIIWPGPASVTGPAAVTGPKTTTNSTSGNQSTQTNSQTSTPLSYNGASVTAGNATTTTTSTTTTTNADGTTSTATSTSSTTTTAGTEAAPQSTEEGTPSDTALPPVPSLYTRKYPNGMEGIWSDYSAQMKGTSLVSLVGKLMPNVGNGGSCPTWPINLDLAQWAAFGTYDVAPPCWIWDVAKAILILSALLLARSLIFGG
jgi:hypothetical protein